KAQIDADPAAAPQDLLTLLLTTRDPEGGRLFGAAEVYDNAMTFILAGHETTANALTWTLYLLSAFPQTEARVAAEIGAADGDPARMPYTKQVLEESLRLYPPAPFISRDSIGPDTVGPIAIRGGTSVLISPWLIQRHRALWQAPDYFDPERFAPGRREAIHRFAYIPFGAGPRICIGMGFAMQEALIVLGQILKRYRLTLGPGHPVVPRGRLTLRPQFGLRMTLEKRCRGAALAPIHAPDEPRGSTTNCRICGSRRPCCRVRDRPGRPRERILCIRPTDCHPGPWRASCSSSRRRGADTGTCTRACH